jgi:hypothetical protein
MAEPQGKDLYDEIVRRMKKSIPGFEVRYKDETWHQKLIAVLIWVFNKRYMVRYTSTFYPCVYFPNRDFVCNDYKKAFKILCHEWVHLYDNQKARLWFPTSYLQPQILALLSVVSLAAFASLWFLFGLLFLVALAPWRSKHRTMWEMRGYSMSMAVNYWRYDRIREATKENIVGIFTGWAYYRMGGTDAEWVRRQLDEQVELIESDKILDEGEPYREVHLLLKAGEK